MKKYLLAFCLFGPTDIAAEANPTQDMESKIKEVEETFQIPTGLLRSVVKTESNFQVKAVGSGSYGLGQITVATSRTHCGISSHQVLLSPIPNLKCSAKVLAYQLHRYSGKMRPALSAYNWGTACKCQNGIPVLVKAKKGDRCYSSGPEACRGKNHKLYNFEYVDKVVTNMVIARESH